MAAFIATYLGPTGQQRTVTVKATGVAEAKKQLRRRGIRATELRTATEPSNSKAHLKSTLHLDCSPSI
jgi:type IV pilus assembly protein PilC